MGDTVEYCTHSLRTKADYNASIRVLNSRMYLFIISLRLSGLNAHKRVGTKPRKERNVETDLMLNAEDCKCDHFNVHIVPYISQRFFVRTSTVIFNTYIKNKLVLFQEINKKNDI